MSHKPKTKSAEITRLKAEVVELRELNVKLAKTLKMVEDGQWVVISEADLKRYQNGIKRLIDAGDILCAAVSVTHGPGEYDGEVDGWREARNSDNFGA